MKIVVAGGGISGLTAAHRLLRAGHDVICVEPSERPGGFMRSERREGFLCEVGPQSMLDGAPDTRALIDELGLADEIVRTSAAARRRMVYVGGRLRTVPSDPLALMTGDLLSASGKWRLVREPFVKARPAPADLTDEASEETVYEFGERRLGPEAARLLVAPATMGIFAGDAKRLIARNAFPKLVGLEERHGSLLKGVRAMRKEGGAPGKAISFREGVERLPQALAAALGTRLVRGRVVSLRPEGGRFRFETTDAAQTADAVVLATPPAVTADLLAPFAPEASSALNAIPVPPAASIALGFNRTDLGIDLDAYGFLVARGEGPQMLGCQYESTVFPGRAPEGSVLLRAILGGSLVPEIAGRSDDELVQQTLADLKTITGLAHAPSFTAVFRWPRGIPQYERGHERRARTVEAISAAYSGLHVLGTALRGVGVNDCIRNATALARTIGSA